MIPGLHRNYHRISKWLLIIIYMVGLIGLNTGFKGYFIALTPVNLLLTAIALLTNQQHFSRSLITLCITIFVLGYLVEFLGVHTGILFGNYRYGSTLGPKLFGIPVIIGINWLILIYSVGTWLEKTRWPSATKIITGAIILVIFDLLMEPVAIAFDFWHWENGHIPLMNYIGWFLVSLVFFAIFDKIPFKKQNRLAPLVFIIQLLFFTMIDLIMLIL